MVADAPDDLSAVSESTETTAPTEKPSDPAPADAPDGICAQEPPTEITKQAQSAEKRSDPDGTDGIDQRTPDQNNVPRELDEIERKYGRYVTPTKTSLKINPVAMAVKFAHFHKIAWSLKDKCFYQCSAEIWTAIDEDQLRRELSEFMGWLATHLEMPGLLLKRDTGAMKNILAHVRSYSRLGEPVTVRGGLLAVSNGLLDLTKNPAALRPITGADWVRTTCPVAWVPEAKCPRFIDELLKPALQYDEDLPLLQKLLGSMLVPGNPGQFILILLGIGGSGKSTLVSIFEGILGRHRFADLRDKDSRFEDHFYQGRSILTGKDMVTSIMEKKGSKLKSLTGADLVETEQKYGGKFPLKGDFNVLITANSPPLLKVDGDEEAWTRRMIAVRFQKAPAIPLPHFDKILLAEEGEGILCWLVEGYFAAQEDLAKTGRFALTQGQKNRRQDYLDASQSVVAFIRDRVARGRGGMPSSEAYEAYMAHCQAKEWVPLTEQKFFKHLALIVGERYGITVSGDLERNGTQVKGYHGLTLRPAQ